MLADGFGFGDQITPARGQSHHLPGRRILHRPRQPRDIEKRGGRNLHQGSREPREHGVRKGHGSSETGRTEEPKERELRAREELV